MAGVPGSGPNPDAIVRSFFDAYHKGMAEGDKGAWSAAYTDKAFLSWDGSNHKDAAGVGELVGKVAGRGKFPTKQELVTGQMVSMGGLRAVFGMWTGQIKLGEPKDMEEAALVVPGGRPGVAVAMNHAMRTSDGSAKLNFGKSPAMDFIKKYYDILDNKTGEERANALKPLYTPGSQMTYEGKIFAGEDLLEQLVKLPPFRRKPGTLDAQPVNADSYIIFVRGEVLAKGMDHPFKYAHAFLMVKAPAGSPAGLTHIIANEIFSLN